MAQKFHQELFLGVSGFQYDIYYRNLQNKKQWFINGQNCKVRNYVWLFHEFRKRKNMYIRRICCKKENMSRGMAVEKPWKGLQMPWEGLKKTWKSLNKAWKGFPNIFFVGCAGYGITEQNHMIQICNFLIYESTVLKTQCSESIYKSLRAGLLLGSYWDLFKQLLMVDWKGIWSLLGLYMAIPNLRPLQPD